MRDYYEILGVPRGSDEAALKSAFRKLAMEHHPDRNGGSEESAAQFKEINEAYSVLSDPKKRAAYDQFGHAGVNGAQGGGGAGFTDINDIFSEVFGSAFGDMFGGGQRRSGPARGQDLRPVTCPTCGGAGRVRASQGFFAIERTCPRCGGEGRTISDPCTSCRGHGQVRRNRTLQVRIPAGVDDGARIRLAGEGDAGARGGPRGDLYIFVSVRPHDLFERDGLDLHCTVPVPMTTAVLGGEIEAPCLADARSEAGDANRLSVKVPEGAQTGRTVRIRGRGMPSLRSRERGDLVVELFVETPTRLNARQKALMQEFADLCGDQQHPESSGFLNKARKFWDDVTGG